MSCGSEYLMKGFLRFHDYGVTDSSLSFEGFEIPGFEHSMVREVDGTGMHGSGLADHESMNLGLGFRV